MACEGCINYVLEIRKQDGTLIGRIEYPNDAGKALVTAREIAEIAPHRRVVVYNSETEEVLFESNPVVN